MLGGLPISLAIFLLTMEQRHQIGAPANARLVVSALIIAITYPVALIGGVAGTMALEFILASAGIPLFDMARGNDRGPTLNLITTLVTGGLIAGSTAALALRVITRTWDSLVWVMFLAAGVGTAIIAMIAVELWRAIKASPADPIFALALFSVGCASFAAIFGYGLLRRVPSD